MVNRYNPFSNSSDGWLYFILLATHAIELNHANPFNMLTNFRTMARHY